MTQAVPARPADRLKDECAAANALLQQLDQEQHHLINAELEEIARSTEEKARLLAQLAELTERRYACLAAAGFSADESGMRGWLDSGANPATVKQWQELLDLARTAKERNRTNGLLIGQQLARNNTALNILQGNSGTGGLYGPSGMTTGQISTRGVVIG